MKKSVIIISLLVVSIAAFAFYRKPAPKLVAERTFVLQQVTTLPDQSTKVYNTITKSRRADGEEVARYENEKGITKTYFSLDGNYLKHHRGATYNMMVSKYKVPTAEDLHQREAGLLKHANFERVEYVGNLKCFVLVRREGERKYQQWVSPEFGLVQYEKELKNGAVDRMKLVSDKASVENGLFQDLPLKLPTQTQPNGNIR